MAATAEFLALTIPADLASYLRSTRQARNGNNLEVTFPTVPGRKYTLESTTGFITYESIPGSIAGTEDSVTIPIGPVNSFPSYFVRTRVGP